MRSVIRVGAKGVIVQDGQVLLVRYEDLNGGHFNFPGGGIEKGESIRKGLRREVYEETSIDVKVGRLLLVSEYDPKKHKREFGRLHKLTLYFHCSPKNGSQPSRPEKPDRDQVGVEWFPLEQLPDTLLPFHHDLIVSALDDDPQRKIFTTRR